MQREALSRLPLSLHLPGLARLNGAEPRHHTNRLCSLAWRFGFQRLLAAYVYFDLLRLSFGFLGQLDLQHALLVVGLNAIMVDGVGEGEGADEAAVLPLHSGEVILYFFLLELLLPRLAHRVVYTAYTDQLVVHSRH